MPQTSWSSAFSVNPTSIMVCISCFLEARQLWAWFVFRLEGRMPFTRSLPSILSALSGLIPYLDHNDPIVPGLLL